jgi:type VI secretion system VasD/TssJ family lipoprotein
MNLTQFTIQKLLGRFPLLNPSDVSYNRATSQPHTEVTAHKDVRRRYQPAYPGARFTRTTRATKALWSASEAGFLFFAALAGAACAHAPAPATPAAPPRVQVLVQAGPALNLGDDGQPWPTAWTLYQLRADPEGDDREPLDVAAVLADPAAALGELVVDEQAHTTFPATSTRFTVAVAPEVTHLLALARFREPLGDASYLVFPVPRTASPCFYLGLDRSELDGGAFPPPGFDAAAFTTTCSPAAAR